MGAPLLILQMLNDQDYSWDPSAGYADPSYGRYAWRWARVVLLVKPLFPIISHKRIITLWLIIGKSGFIKSTGQGWALSLHLTSSPVTAVLYM